MEILKIQKHLFRKRKRNNSVGSTMNVGDGLHSECEILQFWKVFFDFAYWLLILPFRVKFNPVTGLWELHKNRSQLILILVNKFLLSVYFVFKLRTLILKAHDPSTYFEITSFTCDSLCLLVMLHFFGRRGHDMLEIFNEVQIMDYELSNESQGHRKTKIIAGIICLLCVSCMLLSILEVLSGTNWVASAAIDFFATTANEVFTDILPPMGFRRDAKPLFLTMLCFWATVYERILNSFSDILFVMTALWFHGLVRSFLKIAADPTCPPDKVIQTYAKVKRLVECVNSAMALVTASFVIGNLAFYVTNVFELFSEQNIFLRLRYLFYCSYYFPSLFLAAKTSRQMELMNRWTTQVENVQHLPLLNVTLLVSEVSSQPVALDSFGCFLVNFSLVGSIISVIFTYALVKAQFHKAS